ncbi:MAG: 2,3,4,5-tetrahydropyridine-2,6-dicarboxylate N-succinyltransferase [Rhizobacter sp.]|nr:2,3,4,5-tetrahydropyridine-2,6-dicarboxylate N-succinyltransferase [Rhizobacter sp.]
MSYASSVRAQSSQQGAAAIETSTLHEVARIVDQAFAAGPGGVQPRIVYDAVEWVIDALDAGRIRVAERQRVGEWSVHQWVKKAVLLSFRLNDSKLMQAGGMSYFDKVDSKFSGFDEADMRATGVRTVPPAMVRQGAYLARNVVVMPSFVNVGAYVDEGSMVDSWVTVGSCAQIGRNVHLSTGASIGGVLEPVQANPTIVEDNCFVGAHAAIVEGVIVEEHAVIAMGVQLGRSTKILDAEARTISYGRVPSGSVVIPGNLPSADGSYSTSCAVIVKRVDAQTRARTSINELLRA